MRNCTLFCALLFLATLSTLAVSESVEEPKPNRTEIRIDRETIPFGAKYEFSRNVGRGRLVKAQHGVDGEVARTYKVFFENGKPVRKELIEETRKESVDALILMGKAGFTPSRHAFTRHRVLRMEATAYDPSPRTIGRGATGRTATGRKATYGVVAVDPKVIPLGTLVYVEEYGFAIAADTGGAIKGHKIDLCYDDRQTCLKFGRKTVTVHIMREVHGKPSR